MEIIHPHSAGIDIGSRSHFVAVGQNEQDVKEFGVYADDLTEICLHLKHHGITSVAMESTGSYWQNLYVELVKYGFDVTLCNGKFTKNIKGKKTDVKDARWIQKLHSIDLNQAAYQYFEGVDLMSIEGLGHATVLSIISEVGPEGFAKFETAKHFTSWLRLAPNNKISGGKLLSTKTPKGSNRLKIALRNAANAIGNLKDTHLSNFFKRVCFRKGRTVAVSATARKLAVIIWNMVVKKIPYTPPTQYLYLDEKRKLGLAKRIRKQIDKFGLTNEQLGFATA
jgi:transposase